MKNINEIKYEIKYNISSLIEKGKIDLAKSLIKEYENMVSNDIEIYSTKGVVAIIEGNFQEAERILKEGLKIDNSNFDILYNLGYLYQTLEKYNEAFRYYKRALKVTKNRNEEIELKEILNNILSNHKNELELYQYTDRKKVLIIAHIFPPIGGSGVQRTLKFVKYLRNFGWEPIVITAGKTMYPLKDGSLVKEIPEDIKVIRIDEPTTIDYKLIQDLLKIFNNMIDDKELMGSYIKELNKHKDNMEHLVKMALIPDPYIIWVKEVLDKIHKEVDFDNIDLIYSTSGPYSDHILGYYLKGNYNIPWVADFRDEWTNNPMNQYDKNNIRCKIDYYLENKIVQNANKVITTTSMAKDNYVKIFKLPEDKVITITNGYDEDDFKSIKTKDKHNEKFTIIHNGLLYNNRTPVPFILAVSNLIKRKKINKRKFKAYFTWTDNDQEYMNYVKQLDLQENIDFIGYLTHEESLKRASETDALLLIIGPGDKWKSVHAGKIFEYLRLNKPILSLSPKGSVTEDLINETNRGYNVDYNDISGIEKYLLKLYKDWENGEEYGFDVDEKVKKYERKELTKGLSEIFEELLNERIDEKEYKFLGTNKKGKKDGNVNGNLNVKKVESNFTNITKVLFIQSIPDIRTYKVAKVLNDKGVQVDILYLARHPKDVYKDLKLPYKNTYKINNINEVINFINNSDYDVLYSSNEPDFLSALLSTTNKPLIHDCHDMMSLRGQISNEEIILEYLANKNADGNIYVTDLVKQIANKKFQLKDKPIMILDNYILKEQLPKKYLTKLRDIDGEIHCVYEGWVTNIKEHHRNIEDIFFKLASSRIHVHFYTTIEDKYYKELEKKSKYIHWEGVKAPNELIVEMTKYDIGLAVLNVTKRNKTFLDTTFPNKVWEYLAAGLPILFSDLHSFRTFLSKYNVGEILNLNSDIKKQVNRVKSINIDKNFLSNNGLIMDKHAENIIEFMKEVKYRQNQGEENNIFIKSQNNNKDRSLNNILIMTPAMGIGGAEEHTIAKSKWLASKGYGVVVVSKGGEWVKRLTDAGVKHYTLNWIAEEDPNSLNKKVLMERLEALKAIVNNEKIDIIEGHNLYPAVYGYLLGKLCKKPFLIRVMNTIDFISSKKYVPLLKELNDNGLYYIGTKAANTEIEKANGIKLSNCKVIPPISDFHDSLAAKRGNYILTVCRLTEVKRYVVNLISDFTKMCLEKNIKDYSLIIVGDGPLYNRIKTLVNECNSILTNNNCAIEMKGFLYGDELERLYTNCDYFIGSGLSALKAAAYSKPVILAAHYPNDTSVAYGFLDSPDLLLPNDYNAKTKKESYSYYMYKLITDESLYLYKSRESHEVYKENFDKDKVMKRWINEYLNILNKFILE